MGNILSNNIRVFPTTQRENVDPSAKFTTEYNLTSLLNKLLDRKAFVITSDDALKTGYHNDNKKIDNLEFNIMGYFFSMIDFEIGEYMTGDSGYINAIIKITSQDYIASDSNTLKFGNWWQLNGSDDSDYYSGITFETASTPTFTPMKDHLSDETDIGTSDPQSQKTAQAAETFTYKFTILQYDKKSPQVVLITKDSRIKFQTNTDGSQHSLAIDDGELTPADASQQQAYAMRRSTPSIEETFDGLQLNVSNLSLFESELFRLEAEYDKEGDVVFTSSDTNIATVSSNGLVRGVNRGTCLVVASYKDMNAVCNVTVK